MQLRGLVDNGIVVPHFFHINIFGGRQNFAAVVAISEGVWHLWGSLWGPHKVFKALVVVLLAPKMSKMSKNDHKREKIDKTLQNR